MAENISWYVYLFTLGAAYVAAMLMAILLSLAADWAAFLFFGLALVMGWSSRFVYRAKPRSN